MTNKSLNQIARDHSNYWFSYVRNDADANVANVWFKNESDAEAFVAEVKGMGKVVSEDIERRRGHFLVVVDS